MKILLTLDYELFLGEKTGSVRKCLIEPMSRLLAETQAWNVRFTIFVDATYLFRLKEYSDVYPRTREEFDLIVEHLKMLQNMGHEIQLHIHPHWFYSHYDGNCWNIDNEYYKLSDLPQKETEKIFSRSKELLDGIIGKKTIGFRAGGFSAQPTEMLVALFENSGIKIDSSVCPGVRYDSSQQKYDYRVCCNKSIYHFSKDVCVEDVGAKYVEVPVSMCMISPLFYWKYVITRVLKLSRHRLLGDGVSVSATSESVRQRLTKKSWGMATIDGFKISYLKKAFIMHEKRESDVFCVLGHPKLVTRFSIGKLKEFCEFVAKTNCEFVVLSDLVK